eukprot:scaffold46360_cov57-Phaeocystis_antarctica.AAC.2
MDKGAHLVRLLEELTHHRQGAGVDDGLGLGVVAGDDAVALDETLYVVAVDAGGRAARLAQRGEGAAALGEQLVVLRAEEVRQDREGRRCDHRPAAARPSAASAADGGEAPRGHAQHGQLGVGVELLEDHLERALDHEHLAQLAVRGDVADCVQRLDGHVVVPVARELDDDGQRAVLDDGLHALRVRADVGEGPARLVLQRGRVRLLQEEDEAADALVGEHAPEDLHVLGAARAREQLADEHEARELPVRVLGLQVGPYAHPCLDEVRRHDGRRGLVHDGHLRLPLAALPLPLPLPLLGGAHAAAAAAAAEADAAPHRAHVEVGRGVARVLPREPREAARRRRAQRHGHALRRGQPLHRGLARGRAAVHRGGEGGRARRHGRRHAW